MAGARLLRSRIYGYCSSWPVPPTTGSAPVGPGHPGRIRHLLVRPHRVPLHRRGHIPGRLVHRGRRHPILGNHSGRAFHCYAGACDPGRAGSPGVLPQLHEGRAGLRMVLCRPLAVRRRHADPDSRGQLPSPVHRMGAGGPLLLPVDRLLVPAPLCGRGGQKGLYHHADWRRGASDRHPAAVQRDGHFRHCHHNPRCRAGRNKLRDADGGAAAHLPGRNGQVRPVPAARLAARRHGGSDAGQRSHPRSDDGGCRRLPGGPQYSPSSSSRPTRCWWWRSLASLQPSSRRQWPL